MSAALGPKIGLPGHSVVMDGAEALSGMPMRSLRRWGLRSLSPACRSCINPLWTTKPHAMSSAEILRKGLENTIQHFRRLINMWKCTVCGYEYDEAAEERPFE